MTTRPQTVGEILQASKKYLGSVPDVTEPLVCGYCLGPVNSGFRHCYACTRLFPAIPHELGEVVVPMTSVLKPSAWYSRLLTYKISEPEHQPLIASLVYLYLTTHVREIASVLGGEPTIITIVPSKRGRAYKEQPLRHALSMVAPLNAKLRHTLTMREGQAIGRWEYKPTAMRPENTVVKGQRVALIEDTWVTGATAMSAAGALMEAGARSVVVLPVGREVNETFSTEEHPYREAMKKPYDIRHWPR